MKIIKTKFKDLLIIKRPTHNDNRGFLKELFEQNKIKKKFIFDYFSLSKKNVIRGLHLQLNKPQARPFFSVRNQFLTLMNKLACENAETEFLGYSF